MSKQKCPYCDLMFEPQGLQIHIYFKHRVEFDKNKKIREDKKPKLSLAQESFDIFGYLHETALYGNANWDFFCSGHRGKGKSSAMLGISMLIDPEFNLDRIVFGMEDWVELLNSGDLHKGNVVMWEEFGSTFSASSRRFMNQENLAITDIFQVFRTDGLIEFLTLPVASWGDLRVRQIVQGFMSPLRKKKIKREFEGKMYNEYYIECAIRFWVFNPFVEEIMKKIPRADNSRIIAIDVPHPPQKMWERYEVKREEFKKEVYKKAVEIREMKKLEVAFAKAKAERKIEEEKAKKEESEFLAY